MSTPAEPAISRKPWPQTLAAYEPAQRYALAVLMHLLLIVVWHYAVTIGRIPAFVTPTPEAAIKTLFVPSDRWRENIAVTAVEIFAGYLLAVVIGVALAMLFSWSRLLEMMVIVVRV